MKATKFAVTTALFAAIPVTVLGTAALVFAAPWWCAPFIGFGAWKAVEAVLESLHAVNGVETC